MRRVQAPQSRRRHGIILSRCKQHIESLGRLRLILPVALLYPEIPCLCINCRWSSAKSFVIGLVMTFFSIFDVPVFWPILLLYWLLLFVVTMKRQIKHMIKYKYLPFTTGKKVSCRNVMPGWEQAVEHITWSHAIYDSPPPLQYRRSRLQRLLANAEQHTSTVFNISSQNVLRIRVEGSVRASSSTNSAVWIILFGQQGLCMCCLELALCA